MSYDPTERASQPPATPPAYGQSNPALPPYGPPPAIPGQGNPGVPPYGQAPQPPTPYGQSNPGVPPYGQMPQTPYGQSSVEPTVYSQSNAAPSPYGQAPLQQPPATPIPYRQAPQAPFQQPPATPAPYGQSNPALPPYGQGMPSSPSYSPYAQPPMAADPYAPVPGQQYQAGQQQWAASVPPAYPPPTPAKKKGGLKILLIVLIVVIVLGLGGGGTAFYFATRPKPVITVTSDYKVGTIPAGSSSTSFKFTGTDFTGNSSVTFLLDGNTAPGTQPVQSDSKGNLSATLTVTNAWSVGNHTLTAKDAAGYLTQKGQAIAIVTPGQAHTPGPNGAPPDDASGTVDANVQAGSSSGTLTLNIKGSSTGGTVCATRDDGQPHQRTGTTTNGDYTETYTQTCSGTYKGGKLTYTETVTSDQLVFTNGADSGVTCTVQTPYTNAHLEGTFSSATAVSGSYSDSALTLTCSLGGVSKSSNVAAHTGTWTGTAKMQ